MKKKSLEYKFEIDRIASFYRNAHKLPEVKESYEQYINLILADSELEHYEKSELLLYWDGLMEDKDVY